MASAEFAPTVVDLPVFVAPSPPASPVAVAAGDDSTTDQRDESPDPGAVTSSLLFERDQDPSATNPLTYRERVFSVAAGTTIAQAESIARQSLAALKRSLATRPRGRYVTVAVFDHVFADRPTQSPLIVLRWRDWRSDVPELLVRPGLPTTPVAPTPAPSPTPEEEIAAPDVLPPTEVVVTRPEAPPSPSPTSGEPSVASAPVATETEPVVASAPVAAEIEPASVVRSESTNVIAETSATVEALPASAREATPVPVTAAETSTAVATAAPSSAEGDEVPAVDREKPSGAAAIVTAAVVDGDTSGDHLATHASDPGGRRKKRRGRRDSQPSLPTTEPAAPIVAASAETSVVPADRTRFSGGRRGPDLLSDLFDAMMEMSLLHTGDEVCVFVTGLLTQHLRSDAVIVFGYDINRDEFVVHGEANTSRMSERVGAKVGSFGAATRSKRSLCIANARGDDRADAACEDGPAVFAPALHHERLFALIQIARLPGSPAFEADEVDAVTYVAGQLAEALAHHSLRQTATDLLDKKESEKRESRRPR